MNTRLYFTVLVLACFSFFLTFAYPSQAALVVPNNLENTPGNTNNLFPWNCEAFIAGSLRYQQVYSNTQFPGQNNINALRYRLDDVFSNGFDPTTLPEVQIVMSTTGKGPGELSPEFDSNLGADARPVFIGPLTIGAPDCTTSPCPFDIVVPLEFPFPYDPEDGNLLVDIKIFECVEFLPASATFDAENTPEPEATSRASTSIGGSVNDPTATLIDNIGLVTDFELAPFGPVVLIPTLSEWGMIAMGAVLGTIGLIAVRRTKTAA